ncbi:MAG: acyltransferase family protein [Limnochordaceae bacterium]|nr:acyltransferase family protein [Limnochordaceae bacterium]
MNGTPRQYGTTASSGPTRELWIDIAKGVGILAVIVGHSGVDAISHYLYWFHMPLFFAISGYLFNGWSTASTTTPTSPLAVPSSFPHTPTIWGWLRHRAQRLLIPYAGFMALLTLMRYALLPGMHWSSLPAELPYLLAGGRFLTGMYGAVWFVTTLFVTQVLFGLLLRFCPRRWQQLTFIGVAYLLAHAEALFWHGPRIPWNADVALLALTYYAVGFYARQIRKALRPASAAGLMLADQAASAPASSSAKPWPSPTVYRLGAVAWVIAVVWVLAERAGLLHYALDMKYLLYTHTLLDLFIPLTWMVAVGTTCYVLASLAERATSEAHSTANHQGDVAGALTRAFRRYLSRFVIRPLTYLGRLSMPLMYLHFPVNSVLRARTFYYGPLPFIVVGLFVPLALIWALERVTFTRTLLLGLPPTRRPQPAAGTAQVVSCA